MPDLDAIDSEYVKSRVPEGAIVIGLLSIVSFADPETGELQWKLFMDVDAPISTCVGLLELAKIEAVARCDGVITGEPD